MSAKSGPSGSPLHRSRIAGTWYPGSREVLARTVRDLLERAPTPPALPPLLALISPHAGLVYSGPVAAAGYRLLDRFRFDTAILVGPSHFASFSGASVWASGAFETPLGRVPIDEAIAAALLEGDPQLEFLPRPHEIEHSLEMQLPFLQILAPEMAIVPVLMGGQSRGEVDRVAEALASAVARATGRILLIASSDLSHYLPAETAAQLDGLVLEQLNHFEPDRLMDLFERSPNHACGAGPMVAVLKAARQLGGQGARVLRYGDSGDVTGDKSSVVGYLSAAVFGKE
jgi:hypothetical protein